MLTPCGLPRLLSPALGGEDHVCSGPWQPAPGTELCRQCPFATSGPGDLGRGLAKPPPCPLSCPHSWDKPKFPGAETVRGLASSERGHGGLAGRSPGTWTSARVNTTHACSSGPWTKRGRWLIPEARSTGCEWDHWCTQAAFHRLRALLSCFVAEDIGLGEKCPGQGHTVRRWDGQDLNPGPSFQCPHSGLSCLEPGPALRCDQSPLFPRAPAPFWGTWSIHSSEAAPVAQTPPGGWGVMGEAGRQDWGETPPSLHTHTLPGTFFPKTTRNVKS